MEKLIWPLWKPATLAPDQFREDLLSVLAPALLREAVLGLRVAVADTAVDPAAPLRQVHLCPPPDGLLSLWVHSARERDPIEKLLSSHCENYCGYLVTESEPLKPAEVEGERGDGMNQVVFLKRPDRLARGEWLQLWLDRHTPVAMATQSTFAYRQNLVVRALTPQAPAIDAIVEEAFPADAMTSRRAFHGVDTDAEADARLGQLIESCARFIDFEALNVTPMSDYLLKRLASTL